jgi:cyclomaltodextrinase
MPVETPEWVRDAVFYQVFPDRFASSERVPKPGPLEPWDAPPTRHGFKGGDLRGLAERLDYLVDLGVTALYLNPIFAAASNHRYNTYDYFAVDPLLGGGEAFRQLVAEAHGRGMRVILDGVFNHVGRGFWPFHHVVENGAGSPYRDWFYLDEGRLAAGRPLQPYPEDPPPSAAASLERLGYLAWWGVPALPKLKVATPAVRDFLLSVAEHWLSQGADGWRLDVPEEIDDPAFWAEFRRRCKAVRPDAYLVGELWGRADPWLAGDRFDAQMNYPLAKAILAYVAGGRLDRRMTEFHDQYRGLAPLDGPGFAGRLRDLLTWYDPAVTAVQLNLLDSHDTPRFVTFASGDRDAYRLALLLLAALPGAPCIYYGDEIGLEGGPDPDCRRAFPWDRSRWDEGLRAFVQAVLAARRSHPVLRRGAILEVAGEGQAVAVLRAHQGVAAAALVNAGDEPTTIAVPAVPVSAVDLPAGVEGGGRWVWRPLELPGWATPGWHQVSTRNEGTAEGGRDETDVGEATHRDGGDRGAGDDPTRVPGSALVVGLPPRRGALLVGEWVPGRPG